MSSWSMVSVKNFLMSCLMSCYTYGRTLNFFSGIPTGIVRAIPTRILVKILYKGCSGSLNFLKHISMCPLTWRSKTEFANVGKAITNIFKYFDGQALPSEVGGNMWDSRCLVVQHTSWNATVLHLPILNVVWLDLLSSFISWEFKFLINQKIMKYSNKVWVIRIWWYGENSYCKMQQSQVHTKRFIGSKVSPLKWSQFLGYGKERRSSPLLKLQQSSPIMPAVDLRFPAKITHFSMWQNFLSATDFFRHRWHMVCLIITVMWHR